MKQLGELMGRREYDVPDGVSDKELHEHILLSSMRNQTAAVRNWAYPQQMLAITKHLAHGVAGPFQSVYGIDPRRLVDLVVGITQQAKNKLNSHHAKVRSFMRLRNYRRMVEAYNNAWPDMEPIDEEEAQLLYVRSGESCKNLKGMLLAHADLRLANIYSFHLEDLLTILDSTDCQPALRDILNGWSLNFGDLGNHRIEYFVLGNPVLRRPFIRLDEDTYFCPILGILPHLTLSLLENLIALDDSLRASYDRYKSDFLEKAATDLMRRYFPHGNVYRRSLWTDQRSAKQGENDLTVIIDSFALVVECKAGGVTDPAKRGAPLRFKRTLEDLILEPADQAHRFIEYLAHNPGMHILQTRNGGENRIDTSHLRYYVPLTLTIEDLGFISSNLKRAIAAGLIEREVKSLAPSMSIAALECVFELLENEAHRIHYLSRRREFEHHVDYHGDELDLLAFYLENGFNIGSAEYGEWHISLTGKSKELDPYFTGKAIGETLSKPTRQLTKWWRDIINRVCQTLPDHWTELGFILLSSTEEDQQKFEHELFCLKSKLRINRIGHCHKYNWVTFLSGPEQRRYLIAGFPYRTLPRAERNAVIEDILGSALEEQVRGAVVIGLNIDTSEYPYGVIAAAAETRLQDAPSQTNTAGA
jgi:hypothetical protein